jgi:hypothetical protein
MSFFFLELVQRVWPIVKQHFASFHNWDHQMQRIREQFDLVSLTPSVGRARHVGIKGVNFEINEQDPLVAKWLHMHVPSTPCCGVLLYEFEYFSEITLLVVARKSHSLCGYQAENRITRSEFERGVKWSDVQIELLAYSCT